MKKFLFFIFAAFLTAQVFAKERVAVAAFEAGGGVRMEKAEFDTVTKWFTSELAAQGGVTVLDRKSFDKILAEMNFQASDWSSAQKTAKLGQAANADAVVKGQVIALGGQAFVVVSMIDVQTARIKSASKIQVASLDDIAEGLAPLAKSLAAGAASNSGGNAGGNFAVATFDGSAGLNSDERDALTDLFIAELAVQNKMNVVDRKSFDKILAEMNFQASDWSSAQKTALLGKAANATVLISGELGALGSRKRVDVKAIDVQSNEIIAIAYIEFASAWDLPGSLGHLAKRMTISIDVKNGNRYAYADSMLLKAAESGDADAVTALLDCGANPNAKDKDGWTALMWASSHGHSDVVMLLVEHDADVNAKNKFGDTALMWALWYRYNGATHPFVKRRVKLNADKEYCRLIDALRYDTSDIADYLRSQGARE